MTTTALAIKPQQYSLTPTSFDELVRFAEIVAKSDLAPPNYKGKPANIMVAVQMGAEIGISPMQALQNIAVINGRPSVWGDALMAICMAHARFGGITETDDGNTATCTVVRNGMEPVTRTFSMDDARTAGLANKDGPWKQYPKRMRQMRARGFALRDAFPDGLRGIHLAEESEDLPPIVAEVVSNAPARASAKVEQHSKDQLSPEAQKLQDEIDNPAVDPELDPDDYAVKLKGTWTTLGKLNDKQLEWLVDHGHNGSRAYATVVLQRRRDRTMEQKAAELETATKDDAWGLAGGVEEGAAP